MNNNYKIIDKYPLSKNKIPQEMDEHLNDIFLEKRDKFIKLSLQIDDIL